MSNSKDTHINRNQPENDTGSSEPIPGHFELRYSKKEIAERVITVGHEVSQWAKSVRESTQRDVLAVPVLRGGIFFFSDLVRAVDRSLEIALVRTVGYEPTVSGVQADSVSIFADSLNVEGRAMLLVDDICDSGRTFEALERLLRERGAIEVKTAVMIHREVASKSYLPTWIGFNYPGHEWLVGYGMDDAERWRNLPGVYAMRGTGSSGGAPA